MATITIEGEKIVFPSICPVCRMDAAEQYRYRAKFTMPSIPMQQAYDIDFCAEHADLLKRADKQFRTVMMAIFVPIVVAWGFATYQFVITYFDWLVTGYEHTGLLLDTIMIMCGSMLIVFGSIWLLTWLMILPIWSRPPFLRRLIEPAEARPARNALNITTDKPRKLLKPGETRHIVITAQDPAYAQEMHKLNPGSLLES
jgi:hypothetical protein